MIQKIVRIALLLVLSAAVVTAQPAAAANASGLVVASQYTAYGSTGSEPQPKVLHNLTVKGSGSSAAIQYEGKKQILDDADDGDISEYGGGTGYYSASSSNPIDGSHSVEHDSDSNWHNIYDTNDFQDVQQNDTIVTTFRFSGSATAWEHAAGITFGAQSEGPGGFTDVDTYMAFIYNTDGDEKHEIYLNKWYGGTQTELAGDEFQTIPKNEKWRIKVEWNNTGGIRAAVIYPNGTEAASVAANDTQFSSGGIGYVGQSRSSTAITQYDNYQIDDKYGEAYYRSASHTVTHAQSVAVNLSKAQNISANIAAYYYDTTTAGWKYGNNSTVTSSGNHTLNLPSTDSEKWEIRINVSATGANPAIAIADESILFSPREPGINNSSASPVGRTFNDENLTISINVSDSDFATVQGETVTAEWYVDSSLVTLKQIQGNQTARVNLSNIANGTHTWNLKVTDQYGESNASQTVDFTVLHSRPDVDNRSTVPSNGTELQRQNQTFKINLTDRDFAETSGDSVTASLYVDGNKIQSKSVTGNGTVEIQHTIGGGGEHTYYWSFTDEYGYSVESKRFDVRLPADLSIYNETSPKSFVDNVTASVTFYFTQDDPLIINRSTTTGRINLSGLPTNEPFVVNVDASGYRQRQIFVQDLYETAQVYLLPNSRPYTIITFELQDYSGKFGPEDSVLKVERPINGSWRTVEGDYFGATNQFKGVLEKDVRHRLTLINIETGERRVLGTFTPVANSTQTITVQPGGEITFVEADVTVNFDPGIQKVYGKENATLGVSVNGNGDSIENITVRYVYTNESGNETTLKVVNTTNATRTIRNDLNLSNRSGGAVSVVVEANTSSGARITESKSYQVAEYYANDYSLVNILGSVEGAIPATNWNTFAMLTSLFASLVATTAVSVHIDISTEMVGAIGLLFLSAFASLGWFPWEIIFVGIAGGTVMIALRRGI